MCQAQDPEHDIQECVRMAHYSKENDQLVVRAKTPDPGPEPPDQERFPGVHGACHKCGDLLAMHSPDDCQEPAGENIGLRLMLLDTTRLGADIERRMHEWNTYRTEPEEICMGCHQEMEENHDMRACIQRTCVYADEVGEFWTKART